MTNVLQEFLPTKWFPWGVTVSAHRKFRVVLLDESLIHYAQPACHTHSSRLVVRLVLGSEAFIKRSEVEEISTRFPSKENSVSLKEKRKRVGTCLRAGGNTKEINFWIKQRVNWHNYPLGGAS